MEKKQKDGNVYFQCEECRFYYKDEKMAKKCENFCKKHNACSVEITKHAVHFER